MEREIAAAKKYCATILEAASKAAEKLARVKEWETIFEGEKKE